MLGQIAENYYVEKKMSCSQALLQAMNDFYNLGITRKEARLVSGFGGGMGCGNLCGALAGAIAGMGYLFEHDETLRSAQVSKCSGEFTAMFIEKFSTTICNDIKPVWRTEEKACGDVVRITGDMLEEYLKDKI